MASLNVENKVDSDSKANFSNLPHVPLATIFSYLNVRDRMRCTLVCNNWRATVLSPHLWKAVYPTQWLCDFWEDTPCSQELLEKILCGRSNMLPVDYHPNSESKLIKQEFKVLSGFIKNVLPFVGTGVQTFGLVMSGVARARIVNSVLLLCPNLTHLDLSYTCVGESTFEGLWKFDACCNLQYLNFTCCYNLTDKSISNLVECWVEKDDLIDGVGATKEAVTAPIIEYDYDDSLEEIMARIDICDDPCVSKRTIIRAENCPIEKVKFGTPKKGVKKIAGLRYLNLSGCVKLTDQSLYSLLSCKDALKNLEFFDVSGNCSFTSKGLSDFVECCPNLKPEDLYYCLSLKNGPFKFTANGCNNNQSSTRPCCLPLE